MSAERATLTAEEVREAGVDDWRQIRGGIKARFRTADFVTGLALVNAIGEAAEAANHHPDITLIYTDVIVTLSSHGVHGITDRDLDLARSVSACAAELGIEADVSGLTQLELGLDTVHGEYLAPFYAALLGADIVRGEPVDKTGQVPTVWWQDPRTPISTWRFPNRRFSSAGTSTYGSLKTKPNIASGRSSTPGGAS